MSIEAIRQEVRAQALEWLKETEERLAVVCGDYDKLVRATVDTNPRETKSLTNEIAELEVRKLRLNGVLQQIKEIVNDEGDPNTWDGYLALLEADPKYREKEEVRAELGRISVEKELNRLMDIHIFSDGEAGFCITTVEAVDRYAALEAKVDAENYRDEL